MVIAHQQKHRLVLVLGDVVGNLDGEHMSPFKGRGRAVPVGEVDDLTDGRKRGFGGVHLSQDRSQIRVSCGGRGHGTGTGETLPLGLDFTERPAHRDRLRVETPAPEGFQLRVGGDEFECGLLIEYFNEIEFITSE